MLIRRFMLASIVTLVISGCSASATSTPSSDTRQSCAYTLNASIVTATGSVCTILQADLNNLPNNGASWSPSGEQVGGITPTCVLSGGGNTITVYEMGENQSIYAQHDYVCPGLKALGWKSK